MRLGCSERVEQVLLSLWEECLVNESVEKKSEEAGCESYE